VAGDKAIEDKVTDGLTVITVDALAEVPSPLTMSRAVAVAVVPVGAPAATVSTPAALILATAAFDIAKLSLAAARACTVPSLYVPMTVS
jgi:hypothetical protein